ncbi:MAG: hypothetical protein ABEJ87_02435 [Candidatus Nanohalobium sp.]
MPEREVSSGVSSQDEPLDVDGMLDKYNEIQEAHVSNPKEYDTGCNGNIATECIIDGLKNFSDMYEDNDIDTALYGGLATQLRALADSGDFLRVLEPKNFGRRYTSDIDALVTREDYGEMAEALRGYDFEGRPDIDFKKPYIPGTDEIIEEAEDIDFSEYHEDYDFVLPIPQPEHLVFTKAFRPIGNKQGTKHDLKRHFSGDSLFNMNESELEDFVVEHAPDRNETFEILEQFGFETRGI